MAAVFSREPAVCRRCGAKISPNDSYSGYCFSCLLAPALDDEDPPTEAFNAEFAHYRIMTHSDGSLIELGRGSMGVTYKATDTTLRFPVALKVIDRRIANLEINRERFLREARAAARLRHSHVASVFYYGVGSDGQCFYTMEFVEGETLATRIKRSGPLPAPDALELIAQVATALEAAEKQGLIHRDLKPANLMLVDGPGINIKVIDFGLAKVVTGAEADGSITLGGFVGTPAFASPEQFAGAEIDQRSDFFSLGSILFYCLTGRAPFKADRLSHLAQQMADAKSAVDQLRGAGIPSPILELVGSLLSPDPASRPQSAKALIDAIDKCRRRMSQRTDQKKFSRRLTGPLLALVGIVVVGWVLFAIYRRDAGPEPSTKSIAVLPFDNLSPAPDQSYFGEGVENEILTALAKVVNLEVISGGSVQVYRHSANRPIPREIGRALQVRYLLTGSVRREGEHIRVTTQLVEAETEREIWGERYDGSLSDIFGIQSQIAEQVVRQLKVKLSVTEKTEIEQAPTQDVIAYELFLNARDLMQHSDAQTGPDTYYKMVDLLEDATARDPKFFAAWEQLAVAEDDLYSMRIDHSPGRRALAESAIATAMRLQPDSPDIHLEMAIHLFSTDRDFKRALQEAEIATRSTVQAHRAYLLMGDFQSSLGQWADALKSYQKAYELKPKMHTLLEPQIVLYQRHRNYEEARRLLDQAAATGSSYPDVVEQMRAEILWEEKGDTTAYQTMFDDPSGSLHTNGTATPLKIQCALANRDFVAAQKILDADPSEEFGGRSLSRYYLQGWIKRSQGDDAGAKAAYEKARDYYQAKVQKWADDPFSLMLLAKTDAALGRKEDALQEAGGAIAMRSQNQDAIDGVALLISMAQVEAWIGENDAALKRLEGLQNVSCGPGYGELKLPTWDALRSDPRFQKLLANLGPIPIQNRSGVQVEGEK